tara:strand:- start:1891 stop:2745 length:855 start_codon:yes stop_codon:yes gene_type:complete
MASSHLLNIETLQQHFDENTQYFSDILRKQKTAHIKMSNIKTKYTELVKTHKQKIYLFCLDSLYFQYKMFLVEMDYINKYVSMINNRIYGDYYKLYHIIINQSPVDMSDFIPTLSKYTQYRDVEPFFEYKREDVVGIFANIMACLNYIYKQFLKNESGLNEYRHDISSRMSINNFMQTLDYDNRMITEKISLYVGYLNFFHSEQTGRLNKLYARMNMFFEELEEISINTSSHTSQLPDPFSKDSELYHNTSEYQDEETSDAETPEIIVDEILSGIMGKVVTDTK